MIARGPTLAGGGTATGSVHILGLPGPAAARAFAFDEPNDQAGVYRDACWRAGRNLLGRTCGTSPVAGTAAPLLALGLGTGQAADLAPPSGRDELIAYGPLLSDDGTAWLGTAVLLRAPGPDAARAVLTAAGTPSSRCTAGNRRPGVMTGELLLTGRPRSGPTNVPVAAITAPRSAGGPLPRPRCSRRTADPPRHRRTAELPAPPASAPRAARPRPPAPRPALPGRC